MLYSKGQSLGKYKQKGKKGNKASKEPKSYGSLKSWWVTVLSVAALAASEKEALEDLERV